MVETKNNAEGIAKELDRRLTVPRGVRIVCHPPLDPPPSDLAPGGFNRPPRVAGVRGVYVCGDHAATPST